MEHGSRRFTARQADDRYLRLSSALRWNDRDIINPTRDTEAGHLVISRSRLGDTNDRRRIS